MKKNHGHFGPAIKTDNRAAKRRNNLMASARIAANSRRKLMSLSQYEALLKTVETGTMTKAAEELGYTLRGK